MIAVDFAKISALRVSERLGDRWELVALIDSQWITLLTTQSDAEMAQLFNDVWHAAPHLRRMDLFQGAPSRMDLFQGAPTG